MPFVDIDPASDDDKSTVVFVSVKPKASAPVSGGAGKGKPAPPKAHKITAQNIHEAGLTMRQVIELKPSKKVVAEFFKMRIDKAVAEADDIDSTDEES